MISILRLVTNTSSLSPHSKTVEAYAPTKHLKQTTSAFNQELEESYVELEQVLNEPTTYAIIQGDLSAKVGKLLDNKEEFLGRFGIGEWNQSSDLRLVRGPLVLEK